MKGTLIEILNIKDNEQNKHLETMKTIINNEKVLIKKYKGFFVTYCKAGYVCSNGKFYNTLKELKSDIS